MNRRTNRLTRDGMLRNQRRGPSYHRHARQVMVHPSYRVTITGLPDAHVTRNTSPASMSSPVELMLTLVLSSIAPPVEDGEDGV